MLRAEHDCTVLPSMLKRSIDTVYERYLYPGAIKGEPGLTRADGGERVLTLPAHSRRYTKGGRIMCLSFLCCCCCSRKQRNKNTKKGGMQRQLARRSRMRRERGAERAPAPAVTDIAFPAFRSCSSGGCWQPGHACVCVCTCGRT